MNEGVLRMANENWQENRSIFLENQMELVMWDGQPYPIKVYLHKRSLASNILPHWHDECEITCVLDGTADFYVDGVLQQVCAPASVLINSGEMHHIIPNVQSLSGQADIVSLTIQIIPEYMDKLIPHFREMTFTIPDIQTQTEITDRMKNICEYYFEVDPVLAKIKIHTEVTAIVAILYEKCREESPLDSINLRKEKEKTRAVLQYINEHYHENLRQQEIAGRFHFTREHFSRLFKRHTGMTFKEYVSLYRAEKVRKDLLHTDKKLSEITVDHGFSSETKLIAAFKEHYGTTPSKYRKEWKAAANS